MVRLFSPIHLYDLDSWQKCGCPACLRQDGLEIIEVYNPQTRRYIPMLRKAPHGTTLALAQTEGIPSIVDVRSFQAQKAGI